jgi:hypothetical protein
MTLTDDLRKMLDERGVEWDALPNRDGDRITRWKDSNGRYVSAIDCGETQYFDDFYWGPTPQQAIEATLGRGTCRAVSMRERDKSPYLHDELVCSECGCQLAHEFGHVWQHYCPNCGARVVE